jgi:hypothetical protein
MADKKISELTAAPTAITVDDVLPMVQDGDTVKASQADLLIHAIGAVAYATDMALLGVREGQRAEATLTTRANTVDATVATYDSAIENQLLGEVRHLLDLSGMNAKTLAETPRLRAAPASASATGTQGEWAWDSSYIYICTALNTWKRVAISNW